MNVKELKDFIADLPDEMMIIVPAYSDYHQAVSVGITRAVPKDFYVMRAHPTMSEENKSREQDMLCICLDG